MDKPGDLLVFAVGELTQETTKLLQEYRNAKVSIDGKVQLVLATAVDVGLSEDNSKESQLAAANSANEAKIQADKALTVVGGAISHTPNSRMKQLMDANGNFNTMVSIPCFTFDEVNMSGQIGTGVHPAFLRQDGSIIPEIWVGAFTASNKSNNVIVQSDVEPWHTINYDDAKAKCVAMGNGWHMMTAMEWSAIALWCLANDFQPNGNTQYGRSHAKRIEFCKRVDGDIPNTRNKAALGACGSGPNSWRHDNTPFGISDLNGNLWEWIDGFKLVNNKFHISSYSGQPESEWEVTDIGLLGPSGNKWENYKFTGTSEILKQMLIESTEATKKLKGGLFYNITGERIPFKGGTWQSGSRGGLAALNLQYHRTSKYGNVGFRPVFIAD
ncbi:hypothetical protein C0W42_19775 [Photobacterium kishitanii]|uniref:SUMF1/EgtB/PvdO family nonheme iron enzyme n=1 Tax=Photobacterium kishitanii TaxID=318456 RepID=UPI000D155AF8|nr:SUMF1/EgtB/PvdO family nonheme iron enzyme [Photobacterium kishitanii]PSU86657.1 hypothetical protein C0W42_19775 [Photobacterium kishitanii]PSV11655.1 hypothetical protein C0W59_19165 [Photobacterium kishitanii]